jgi:hypothetical protein
VANSAASRGIVSLVFGELINEGSGKVGKEQRNQWYLIWCEYARAEFSTLSLLPCVFARAFDIPQLRLKQIEYKNMKFAASKFILMISLASMICYSQASAQDSIATENSAPFASEWNFLLEPYLMFPNMKGNTGVGTIPDVNVDASPGDIFNRLTLGAMLYFEASTRRWAFSSDVIYMNLKQDLTPGPIVASGEANAKQFAWELAGLKKITPMFDAGIGFRFNSLKMGIDLFQKNLGGGTTARAKSLTESWVDPFIVARLRSDPVKKFVYQFRGDIGGFGIGSDLAWQIQAYAGYRFSKLFQLTAGYRILGIDYDKGTDESRFLYNVDTFGPVVRFGFSF